MKLQRRVTQIILVLMKKIEGKNTLKGGDGVYSFGLEYTYPGEIISHTKIHNCKFTKINTKDISIYHQIHHIKYHNAYILVLFIVNISI